MQTFSTQITLAWKFTNLQCYIKKKVLLPQQLKSEYGSLFENVNVTALQTRSSHCV